MISITLVVEEPDATRTATAFGKKLGLEVPATEEQIKDDVAKYLQQVVLMYEQAALSQQVQARIAEVPPIVVA